MHAPLRMAEEWSFQMNAKRMRASLSVVPARNPFAQMFKSPQDAVFGRGDGGGQITGDPVAGHVALDGRQRRRISFHHVVAGAAMHVDINETGCDNRVGEVKASCMQRYFHVLARINGENASLFDDNNRRVNALQGSEEAGSGNYGLHYGR